MSQSKWYDSDDPEQFARGFGWTVFKWMLVALVTFALLGAVIWGIGVATSDTAGRGEATKLKNNAVNRTQAQAQFHATYESIRSLDQRLADAQVQLDAYNQQHPNVGNGTPFDPQAEQQANLQRSVIGLQQQCRRAVGDYNASTETYTLRDFRDSDLPFKIDANDPLFSGTSPNGKADFTDFDCTVTANEKEGK